MKREITIKDILLMLRAHVILIVVLAILAAGISFTYSKFFIKPMYSASALIYVSNSDTVLNLQESTQSATEPTTSSENRKVSSSDFESSAKIASTCSVLFKTDIMMNLIIDDIGNSYSAGALKGMISISAVQQTQALSVTITCSKPDDAAKIANSFAANANKVYRDFIPAGGVRVIEEATVPGAPSSPNVNKDTMLGFAVGLVIGIILALFIEIIDTTVKSDDDLYKMYKIPVFAEIADYEAVEGKG